MSRYIEPNYKMLFDSAVIAKQIAYQEYKKIMVLWIQSSWIGRDGEYVIIKSEYAERLEKAYDKFIDASIEVEHYRKLCADMRGEKDVD